MAQPSRLSDFCHNLLSSGCDSVITEPISQGIGLSHFFLNCIIVAPQSSTVKSTLHSFIERTFVYAKIIRRWLSPGYQIVVNGHAKLDSRFAFRWRCKWTFDGINDSRTLFVFLSPKNVQGWLLTKKLVKSKVRIMQLVIVADMETARFKFSASFGLSYYSRQWFTHSPAFRPERAIIENLACYQHRFREIYEIDSHSLPSPSLFSFHLHRRADLLSSWKSLQSSAKCQAE